MVGEADARGGRHLDVGVERVEREQRCGDGDLTVEPHRFGARRERHEPFGVGERRGDVCSGERLGEFVAGLGDEEHAAAVAGVRLECADRVGVEASGRHVDVGDGRGGWRGRCS